jgi:hypothetical protein
MMVSFVLQLLLSDIDEVALKYERLKDAYIHYSKSARLNRLNTAPLYDAGMVMYQMLALVGTARTWIR